MMPTMPLRVALSHAGRKNAEVIAPDEERGPLDEVLHSLPAGVRSVANAVIPPVKAVASKILGAPGALYDYTHEAEGRAFPQGGQASVGSFDPPPPPPVAPPLAEPTAPPPKETTRAAAHGLARVHQEELLSSHEPPRPSSFEMVTLPGGRQVNYGDGTASQVRREFSASRGGKPDTFASSRAGGPSADEQKYGYRPSDAQSTMDWNAFLDHRDREDQARTEERARSEAATSGARAQTARSRILEQNPLAPEEMARDTKLGLAAVTARTETSRRDMIMEVVNQVAAKINDLNTNPKYASMTPADKNAAREQLMNQAYLTLGALDRINLSPKASNPLDAIAAGLNSGAEPKKE